MWGVIIGILGTIGSWFLNFTTNKVFIEVSKFVAYKVLLCGLLFLGLAFVLRSFVLDFALEFMQTISTDIADAGSGMSLPSLVLDGPIGYVANLLKTKECVSILISGYTVGLIRSFVPFM